MQGALSPESPSLDPKVYLRDSEQNTSGGGGGIQAQLWDLCRAILPTLLPAALHGHTHCLPAHFPPTFPPVCFLASHCGQAGSFGLCTDTNKRNNFIFILQIHPFNSHAHSARSCPDKRGAPGAVGVCQQPKTATVGEEGHPGFLLCPRAQSLGDPATGKGLRGRCVGGCGVWMFWAENILYTHPVCTWWKTRMEWAAVRAE